MFRHISPIELSLPKILSIPMILIRHENQAEEASKNDAFFVLDNFNFYQWLSISLPTLIDLGDWFFDVLYKFWFSIDWLKKGQILCFWPLSFPSPKLEHDRILAQKRWKAHLGLLLNIRNKFQLPSSIWRGAMRGTNSRNDRNGKTRQLNHFFEAVRGCNGAEKS